MIRNPASSVSDILNTPAAEQGQLVLADETGVVGSFRLTAPAFAGTAQADYFTFQLPTGETYAVWLDKDAAGVVPTGAAYVAAQNKVMASIVTGDTAAQVAAAIATALGAVAIDILDNTDGTLDFTQQTMGDYTAPARHNADDSGNGSLALSLVVAGVDSNHLNKYQKIWSSDETEYFIWYDVNSEGVAPSPGGTAIPITVAVGDTGATIAAAVKTALDGKSKWTTTRNSATLTIVDLASGDSADIDAGNGPDSASNLVQGSDAQPNGAVTVDSLSNNPSIAH